MMLTIIVYSHVLLACLISVSRYNKYHLLCYYCRIYLYVFLPTDPYFTHLFCYNQVYALELLRFINLTYIFEIRCIFTSRSHHHIRFGFYEDGLKFLLVLAFFALGGFIYSVIILHERGATPGKMVLRGLDLITTVCLI